MQLSYSSISTYKACPAKFKYSRIDKLPDPPGEAALRGTRIHSEVEEFFTPGALPILSAELEPWRFMMEDLLLRGAKSEVKFSLDKNLERCDWEEGSLRGVIDLTWNEGTTGNVIDWKTGRVRDYDAQLKLYSLALLTIDSTVDEVKANAAYLDHPFTVSRVITTSRKELEAEKTYLKTDIDRISNDKIYAPNPSTNCRYCAFRKDAGGPCRW